MGATEAVQLVNECVKLGGLAFPQAAEAANLFNAVGLIFLATMNLAPGSPNYNKILHEDMQQLKLGVSKLHQEMRQGFQGVESLIVEHSFTKDIIHKVENQERFLDNLLSAGSNTSLDQFIHECELNRPQTLLSNIIGFIKHDVTNPIKYTMNASPLESKAILKQWRKKIQNLAGSLSMIHGMYLGVSYYQKYLKDDGTMKKNIQELETVLKEFEQNFKLKYWDSVTTLVESTMDSRTDLWNDAKADLLKDALNGMYTNDQFYIIVYDEVAGHDHHSFLYDGDKTLVRYRRGGCNVVVYASETAYKTSNKDYDWLKGKVESWRDGYIPNHNSLKTIAQEISDNINWQGFVGLIRAEHNPIIRSTGKDWKWGPGWWITANGPNQIIPKLRAAGRGAYLEKFEYTGNLIVLIVGLK